MRKPTKWIAALLAIVLLLSGCSVSTVDEATKPTETINLTAVTSAPTEASTTATAALTTQTEAPTTKPTTVPTTAPTIKTAPTTTPTTVPTTPPAKTSFSVHFIDVGQADAALVECDGHYMLIDGGNKADSNVIYSVLKKAAVPKLDIVVGTHAHEDHIGGLPGAFNYTTADITLCPVKNYDSNAFEDFAKYATQKGGGITVPKKGDTYSLGSATVKILGVNGGSDTNDTSIVLRIDYGKTSFLFTGDAEREAEQAILSTGEDLSATVLKVGHHGSDTSTSYPFLREIMPKYAVISVGTGNSYGHPTEDTLSRLRDADVKVFRTDVQGDIFCTSDGNEVTFSVTRNAGADVFGGIGENSTQTKPTTAPTTPPTTKATTEPENTPVVEPVGDMVWIPKTGKKYHSSSSCSNMKNPSKVTRSQAIQMGYDPCKKCY
ncbi:MAG: MBL fold metallo-hydrolase [Oscillospiraceae bacterium]|nr:MBL fold metallo-hydrolase [Oscillospiraceae bacterium]